MATTYTQSELPYLYCSRCLAKTYRLDKAGLACNGQPTNGYTGGYCQGVWTASTANLAQRTGQSFISDHVLIVAGSEVVKMNH